MTPEGCSASRKAATGQVASRRAGPAALVLHPGPTVGFRLDTGRSSLAYLPDHEPGLGTDLTTIDDRWISGFGVAHDVDLLIHDGQYTVPEYNERIGWGHSSTPDAVTFAERARHEGRTHLEAAQEGAAGRLRAVLMTAAAMTFGMVPMAIGFGEGGSQAAPLGRGVIGG